MIIVVSFPPPPSFPLLGNETADTSHTTRLGEDQKFLPLGPKPGLATGRNGRKTALHSAKSANLHRYWDIGRIIAGRQQREGWGAAVIPRLSRELANELPEEKGFSERNIGRMIAFYREYADPTEFLPQPVAKLKSAEKVPQLAAQLSDSLLSSVPWAHHVLLIEKVKDRAIY